MPLEDLVVAVQPGHGLAQPDHRLQLTHRDPPAGLGGAAAGVPLAEGAVLLHQELHGVLRQLRLEQPREADVPGNVFRLVDALYGLLHPGVEVDDAAGDGVVGHLNDDNNYP